jgi:GTP-binding protein
VGAPNVGKSTLFNRLVGRRTALVTNAPGVTRDRNYGVVSRAPRRFRLVDTGGLDPGSDAPFAREIERQAAAALEEAALLLLVVDVRAGLTAVDRDVAAWLRRRGAAVIPVANKSETEQQEHAAGELHALGLGEPIPVSAEHGRGIDELLEAIAARLPEEAADEGAEAADEPRPLRVAIVGRPNVGKSSLLNALVGEERVVVSEVPGTTRDSVDTLIEKDGKRYTLVDTAGIRRRGKVGAEIEGLSALRSRRAIESADAVVLVLDGTEPLAAQDAHVAGYVHEAEKPFLVAVNKWDIVEDRGVSAKAWEASVRERLRFAKEIPVVFVSAKTGQRVWKLVERAEEIHEHAGRRVATPELNRWLQHVAEDERAAPAAGRSVRLFYATQTGVHPPRFVLFCNDARRVHFSLRRRLENSLRERFEFGASPMRLTFRSRREAPGR